jgi:hypothetical protein
MNQSTYESVDDPMGQIAIELRVPHFAFQPELFTTPRVWFDA